MNFHLISETGHALTIVSKQTKRASGGLSTCVRIGRMGLFFKGYSISPYITSLTYSCYRTLANYFIQLLFSWGGGIVEPLLLYAFSLINNSSNEDFNYGKIREAFTIISNKYRVKQYFTFYCMVENRIEGSSKAFD